MALDKTRGWLRAAGHEGQDPEWFLAMWYTQQRHELTWKDSARDLQAEIRNPPTYEGLEEQFFSSMGDDTAIAKDFTHDFYGGT